MERELSGYRDCPFLVTTSPVAVRAKEFLTAVEIAQEGTIFLVQIGPGAKLLSLAFKSVGILVLWNWLPVVTFALLCVKVRPA